MIPALAVLRAVPLRTWAYIGAAAVLVAGVLWLRAHWIGVGEERVQAQWDAAQVAADRLAAEQAEAARKLEARWRADYDAAVARLIQENNDARQAADRTIADLRSGALRLQDRFRCPAPAGVPGAAAGTGGGDAAGSGGLRDEDAEFLVREAERADAVVRQLHACQAVIAADRKR